MKTIIAGCRDFKDYNLLKSKCDSIFRNIDKEDIIIISGMASGADSLGEKYAREREHLIMGFPANWNEHGKKAGFIRNTEMAEKADALIAFWDGKSKGTKMMIEIAKRKKLKIRVIKYTI